MNRLLAPLLLLTACAQVPTYEVELEDAPGARYGLELQAYPAGYMLAVRRESDLSDKSALSFRAGWNESDRGDWGDHDEEEGGGFGLGVGYTRWLQPVRRGWFWGGQLDLWQLDLDWEDDAPAASGATDVLVLQPTLVGGYSIATSSGWRLDWTASLGAEINVDTDGEDVGEGAIFLFGLRLTRD